MTDLRTAARQALEYMKSVGQIDMYPEEWAIVGRLEAALAQEPVAWAGCGECDCAFPCHGGKAREMAKAVRAQYA